MDAIVDVDEVEQVAVMKDSRVPVQTNFIGQMGAVDNWDSDQDPIFYWDISLKFCIGGYASRS